MQESMKNGELDNEDDAVKNVTYYEEFLKDII